jgi:hypothetical protein
MPEFQSLCDTWKPILKTDFARIFHIPGFINRFMHVNAQKKVAELLQKMNTSQLYTYLNKNKGKKLDFLIE